MGEHGREGKVRFCFFIFSCSSNLNKIQDRNSADEIQPYIAGYSSLFQIGLS